MTRWLLIPIVVWAATSSFALGDDRFKRFQLWNQCQAVFLGVDVSVSDGLGLAEAQVTTAARSRLRAARMYIDSSDAQILYPEFRVSIFDVDIVHERKALAVAIRADFRKILEDHLSNEHNYATTWTRGVVIAYSDSPYIISVVSQIMDEFIDEYLEVNDVACNAASTPPSMPPLCEHSDVRPCLGEIVDDPFMAE